MAQHHQLYNKALLPKWQYTLLVFAFVVFSIVPLNAQKSTVKYSDKNMQWIISRLNTELAFEEFSQKFEEAEIKEVSAITATASLTGQVYHYQVKRTHYYVYVNEQGIAKYAHAYSFDAKVRNKLLKLPIYDHKKRESYSTVGFDHEKNTYYLDGSRSTNYLFWGDEVNKLLIRMSADYYKAEDISVMVNGWYKEGNLNQWKGEHWQGIKVLPMDFDQLQNLEALQRPKEKVALRDAILAAWKKGRIEDLFEVDLSKLNGICITGCDDPNGSQEIFYPGFYYRGPVKNGIPHGQADYFSVLKTPIDDLENIIVEAPLDHVALAITQSTNLNFSEGKAVGETSYNGGGPAITYEQGKAVYVKNFETDMALKVLGKEIYIDEMNGAPEKDKLISKTEIYTYKTGLKTTIAYKGEINEDFQADGKGIYYDYYMEDGEEDKLYKNQTATAGSILEATWVKGQVSQEHLAILRSNVWTISGTGLTVDIRIGLASGEKVSVIRNKTPEYRVTGKMVAKPICPTGTWTYEKLNTTTQAYEPFPVTDEYAVENGYCMFKGSYDEKGNITETRNFFNRSEYITLAARKERDEKTKREKELADQKRFAQEQQRERDRLVNFELLLKKAVGSNTKIASEGWMTNFLDGETTGTAGLFIINTSSSSKSFSGKVSYSHPTNGSEEKDITIRVGGADSSGYGGAYTSFNLGYGSPYKLKLKLNGNTSGVYYFIYYKGLLIR